MGNDIVVRGASENNLHPVDADIPHGRITVITGILHRRGVKKLGSNLTLLYDGS
jgi:excinuclease UvrABC ATPase subunit